MEEKNDISQDVFESIESYFNGTLIPRELDDFNRLLDLDDDFKTQVEEVKTILLGIETQSLKELLNEFHKDIPKTKIQQQLASKKVRFSSYSKIAIIIAMAVVVGSIWFFSGSPNERLYTSYFKPDPGLSTTTNTTNNFGFYDAMVNYKRGDYEIAINKWEKLTKKTLKNDTLNYFIGVALMANKNVADAIPYLENTVEAPDDFVFLDKAYYYLGLAYLKEGNIKKAKSILGKSYLDKSNLLINELND
ncbi:hypothetical protein MHTCC0001_14960 [Flavobacteriaceae bacterium MHTCC 0001]